MKRDASFKELVENALDFLRNAIERLEAEPKYSVINFYAAVELFLKARLLAEHWSLIVLKDADRDRFAAGDFVSVGFDEACLRLSRVVKSGIPDEARKSFDAVRKHRNKMVHFFLKSTTSATEQIAVEQLRAWYDLHQLLIGQWTDLFSAWAKDFADIERRLRRHRHFLGAKFERLREQLRKLKEDGVSITNCASCLFDAAKLDEPIEKLFEAHCLVCSNRHKWLSFACPSCSHASRLEDGGSFTCEHCKEHLDEARLVGYLNEDEATIDNYFEHDVPANCGWCDGYHTVVAYKEKYLCVRCLEVAESLEHCGWCNEANTGDMSESYWAGCNQCDGKGGAERD